MSRTVRCKGFTPSENSLISREEHVVLFAQRNYSKDRYSYRWFRRNWDQLVKETFEETRKAELKKAHSDHGWKYFWHGTPPASFRRELNAQRRVQEKHQLIRSLKKDLGESYMPVRPPRLNDVWWMWD